MTVRVQPAPTLSYRQIVLKVAAKTRVADAKATATTAWPSITSCAAFGTPAYGFVPVGRVTQLVPQSAVSHNRFVPNAASVGAMPGGVVAKGEYQLVALLSVLAAVF